ncbi:MAG: NAD-dependent epimerase/dehydratase family protein [Candidatus Bathyarchaeia archaeon]
MRILVTGGCGRLGSSVVRALSERKHLVRVFDLPFVDFSRVITLPNVEVFKGDITQYPQVRGAMDDMDAVLHLAAILPPHSEKRRDRTMAVNVDGTENILRAIQEVSPEAFIAFSSSVSVYGNTAHERPPIGVDHPLAASDIYSESKVLAEKRILEADLPYCIMRISGIWGAEVFEFPEVLQFRADQRTEFIDREDVVRALASSLEEARARDRVFNIAGGETWQMTGGEFVERLCEAIGVEVEVDFSEEYGWFDWYDTTDSQRVLNYQRTSFDRFLDRLRAAFEELFGG